MLRAAAEGQKPGKMKTTKASMSIYKSYAINLFFIWKLIFVVLLIPSLLIGIFQLSAGYILIFAFFLIGLIVYFVSKSYSVVSYDGETLRATNNDRTMLEVSPMEKITRWWSYDFGMSSVEFNGDGPSGKSRPHVNKINVYAKIESSHRYLILCEEIHLGDKFPNAYPYVPNLEVDPYKTVKVWDLDKCLVKLGLQDRESRTNIEGEPSSE